ncbi:MAG: sugar ABC transporter substrate-binding protein [Spirochaetes bacterium]|nr:MAG: sugar ABC transporter substrate-binding protein [Spirochaetota bacterium]
MKKLKFILVLFLVLIFSATFVFAGGSKEGAKPAEKKVTKQIKMTILGIGGWPPSKLGVDMSPMFAKYAKEKYGYDATFSFQEAPFSALFQKAASSLATRSQEYNIIISDSQWLGAFAEPGWIVKISDIIKENPELNIEWFDPVVKNSYMVYPDGTDQLWGMPEEGDVIVLYVRKDLFSDPKEMKAFKSKYGFDLPQTFEDWEKITMTDFEKIAEFFTRPDKDLYGTCMEYSKEYDFMTMFLYPFMFSLGGEIWDPQQRKIWGILNSDINAKAMVWNKKMLRYQPPGAINYGISEENDAFTQGKLATAFMWAAMGPAMITDKLKGKVIVVPPPAFKRQDGSTHRIYSIGGQPWVINKFNDKDHMRVAIDFLKWWYKPETQLEFAKRGGNPTDKATLTSPGFENIQPWFRAYKYMLHTYRARDFWHEPKYSEMLAAQQAGWTAYASGEVSNPKNTLDWIACQQQKILYEAGRSKIAPPDVCKNIKLK